MATCVCYVVARWCGGWSVVAVVVVDTVAATAIATVVRVEAGGRAITAMVITRIIINMITIIALVVIVVVIMVALVPVVVFIPVAIIIAVVIIIIAVIVIVDVSWGTGDMAIVVQSSLDMQQQVALAALSIK